MTDEEVEELSRCKNFTLKDDENGRGKNIKYNPHAFTEQGIYMLMTVLRGELPIKQNIAEIKKSLNQVEDDIAIAMGELSDVVRKSEPAAIQLEN